MRGEILVDLKPTEDEGWQPPEGSQTLDGQFYLTACSPDHDLAAHLMLLRVLFQHDYWLYFRILQGAIWELESDSEEWALRWRNGRLQDLGFPSWDDAMRIYGFIRPDQRAQIPEKERAIEPNAWHMPVWMPRFPAPGESRHAIFRALAELAPEERQAFYYELVALANMIAVADGRPLGDAETLPGMIEKAAALSSGGLEFIAREQGLGLADVLRRVGLEPLFRVGANLDPELAQRGPPERARPTDGRGGGLRMRFPQRPNLILQDPEFVIEIGSEDFARNERVSRHLGDVDGRCARRINANARQKVVTRRAF